MQCRVFLSSLKPRNPLARCCICDSVSSRLRPVAVANDRRGPMGCATDLPVKVAVPGRRPGSIEE